MPTFRALANYSDGTAGATDRLLFETSTNAPRGTAPASLPVAVASGANGLLTGADKAKLDGVATSATANSTDAFLRDRANHTSTQAPATIAFATTARILGRTTAGAGTGEELTATQAKNLLEIDVSNVSGAAPLASPAFTGNPTEQFFDAGTKQGAVTIDYTQGAWQRFVTGTGNITSVAISNTPASGRVAQITLEITQGATPRTIAWGASFRFPGGTDHTLTATANAIDIFTLVTRNGGTNWYVFDSGKAWAP